MGGPGYAVDAALLAQTDGHGVDAHGKGLLQRDVGTREATVGIGRCPGYFLAVVHHFHREVFVLSVVAGSHALVHGLAVDEELERGARLAHGCHLVVFPRLEVYVAHPGLHVACLGLDGHEAAVHEVLHVADGVHGRHLAYDAALVVVEELHLVGHVQVMEYGVLVAFELATQVAVVGRLPGQVFNEVGYLLVPLVAPRGLCSPVLVEGALYLLHLLHGGVLGIALHPGVERGIYLETLGVQRVAVISVLLAPVLQVVGHGLAEVVGLAVVGILNAEVQVNLRLLQRVARCLRQMPVQPHVVQHYIPAGQRVLRVDARVIVGGSLQQSHQDGRLLGGQIARQRAEVGLRSGLDAKGVRAEVHRVGIHRQNLFLGEVPLQLVGSYPFLALHDEHLQPWYVAQQARAVLRAHPEQVLGQLLGDGRRTARIVVHQVVLQCRTECLVVDAVVLVEALVLRVHQSLPEHRGHLIVGHRHTVFREELAYHLAVGRIYLRGFCRVRVLHVGHRR